MPKFLCVPLGIDSPRPPPPTPPPTPSAAVPLYHDAKDGAPVEPEPTQRAAVHNLMELLLRGQMVASTRLLLILHLLATLYLLLTARW